MFLSGLSNHDIGGECDFWSSKDYDYDKREGGGVSYNPLIFYSDISETCDIGERGERFTEVYNKLAEVWISVPNKIIRVEGGKTYVHTKIYISILKGKVTWVKKCKDVDITYLVKDKKG